METANISLVLCAVEVSYCDFSNLSNKLLFQIVPVIHLALMKVKQEEQENCDAVALHFQVFDGVYVEENVAVNMREAQEDAEDFQIVFLLDVFVGNVSTLFAFFEAVIIDL